MPFFAPASSSTKETTNYSRLCRVLVDVGTCALRDCFDAICTPPTLHTVLAANQPTLQTLRSRRIINATQWGKLFPAIPASVSSKNFDITLLMTLLRNICGLTPPVTGWDVFPAATDTSREADIARVKYFRNVVYAHAEQASVDDSEFHRHWKEIRDTLVRLGGVNYKVAIDDLEVVCMDPDMECHYKDLLAQWKYDEDNIKNVLKEIEKKLDDLMASAMTSTVETSKEEENLKLEKMLDTSSMCREENHEKRLLTSFCKQCKVCICDKCEQTRHSHHPMVDIHQAAEHHKVDIQEVVEEMKRGIADFEKLVERKKVSFRKSKERITTARNQVMTSVEELVQLLREHEKTMITGFDITEGKDQREHAAQLEHFQISINQLQKHVEWCDDILLRNKSVEILQAHHVLIGMCKGLLNAEKLHIYKPSHVRYEINKDHVENVRNGVLALGKVVVSKTDPLQSVAEGSGLQEGDVGSEATIKIKTKDSDGNQCYDKDDQIDVKVQSPSGKDLSEMIGCGSDGEYSATYTPDCVGQHEVLISVNGEPLTGSPWSVHVTTHRYKSLFSFGSHGEGHLGPSCIAIDDKSGNVAMAGFHNGVQLFSLEGAHLRDIDANNLTSSISVAFTKSGELIVIASYKIYCFNESYKLVKHVANKHLKQPQCLTIAPDGRMVVCDCGDHTVKVLSSDGSRLLLTITDPDGAIPWHAVSHHNKFFVSYPWAGNVKMFSGKGTILKSIGGPQSDDGQLSLPVGLAIDRFDNLLVCDYDKERLQIFNPDGKFVSTIEGQNIGLSNPRSVAASSTGQLFVIDLARHCVHVFQ